MQWIATSAFHPLLARLSKGTREVVKKSPARSVTRHHLDGRTFYIKTYFYSARYLEPLKYFFKPPPSRKEWDLAPQLESLRIRIVPHLAHGEEWSWRGLRKSSLITEGRAGFAPMQRGENATEMQVALGRFLRRLHDCHIFHSDLHISNLLYSRKTNEFCLVDLDNMKIFPSLTEEQRILNLATLNGKLPLTREFYESYGDNFLRHQHRIARRTDRRLRSAIPRKLELLFQDRQAFASRRFGGLNWNVRLGFLNDTLESILREPDAFLANVPLLLKNGTSSTVGRSDGFVLKRSNLKKPQNLFFDLFRSSRARRAFRLARHLELLQIATPRPIAMAERRRCGLVVRSYFAMEEVLQPTAFSNLTGNRRVFIERLAELIAKLHDEGFAHRDLREANILFRLDGEPSLIDLDGLRYVKKTSARRAASDIARLMQGIKGELKKVPASQRVCFLKKYCQIRQLENWRWWWNEVGKNLPSIQSTK
ncbi:MAG: lipopolysaccharide kinase InaA family protein [Verrucomicrobiota bacterium]